ncbi:TrmB family transcriptional regulator [Candidatus Woesearchaeota archaeon]|nr:TrmB family transcriptional regulator [Candidatus Woesearchaeota archaeon]
MIIGNEVLNKLKDFGLNSYEAKLWTSLLSRGISSAGELSDIANVPRSRTYDVLESLERKGFIIMKIGKPIKYIAVSPEEVVERVKKKIRADADNHTKLLDTFKSSDVLKELNLLHSQGIDLVEPTEMSGTLKGRKNLYNHMESIINGAEHSVVIMTTKEGLKRKANTLYAALRKAKARGVDIRIAADVSDDGEHVEDLKEFAEIRHTDDIQGRFVVADQQHVVFTLLDGEENHPNYDGGIWVNTPFFAKTLHGMFEKNWDDMKSL